MKHKEFIRLMGFWKAKQKSREQVHRSTLTKSQTWSKALAVGRTDLTNSRLVGSHKYHMDDRGNPIALMRVIG